MVQGRYTQFDTLPACAWPTSPGPPKGAPFGLFLVPSIQVPVQGQ